MNGEIGKSSFSFAAPDGLKVNMLAHAYGIERKAPSFSWVMHSNAQGDIQTGYRILIVNRLEDLREQSYLLDTGWIATDESSDVTIAGLDAILKDNELYYWAVQLRNRSGAESTLSEPCAFTTAVGGEWEDTRGIWCEQGEEKAAFCVLRTEFKLTDLENVEKAVVSVTAASPEATRQHVYQLMLNGSCVGVGPAPFGKSAQGEQLVYYHSYDVTALLCDGANALGAINYTTEEQSFLCQLTAFYKNGSKRVLVNSARDAEQFGALDATAVFASGHFTGVDGYSVEAESIDATAYPFGFDRAGFADVWPTPQLRQDMEIEHESVLVPYPGEPVGRFLQDVAQVECVGEGHYLIDLGHEIVGGLHLELDSPDACAVQLYFGEELDESGAVLYQLRTGAVYREQWALRPGQQTLESFHIKAFRFVEIVDCPVELTEQNVRGVAIRQDFDAQESSFRCSNEVLCGLYDTYKYAVCATAGHLYVDSQAGARLPRESSTMMQMLASYTYSSHMSLPRFSLEYLLMHPTAPAEYAWLAIHMVRLDYLYSGNGALLRRAYPLLRKQLMSVVPDETVGLLADPGVLEGRGSAVLVDEPERARDGYRRDEACYNTVYNALYYMALRDMTVMASVLGKEDEATQFRGVADALRGQMIARLYDGTRGAFSDGLRADGTLIDHFSQHATAYALCAGIYSDEQMKDTLGRTLVGQDAIRMSIYGAFWMLDALYRAGFGAYATALLADNDTSTGAHTFSAALTDAYVTISPDAWNAVENPRRSLCDLRGAAPAALLVRDMFGIRPTRPGFHKFEIRPQIGDLPYASIRVPTVKGVIGVSLGQNNEAYEAEVTVPPNTKATVYLPILPGGTDTLFVNQQIANFPVEGDCFCIELGSGTHRLLAQ